ncbi:MAG TPA: GNAT family N-acetyltransferase [Gaiellaceae bacterium]|nr:GNAT family N-acetyltransferase [Gaiellaceae bacterium]
MQIRETDSKRDVDALVELLREETPWTAINRVAWLHRESSVPARAQLGAWVAELDGEVVGESWAFKTWWMTGPVSMNVAVLKRHQGHGIGAALYERAIAHADSLAPTRIMSGFFETPQAVAFAHARGFAEERAERIAVVDPRTIRDEPAAEVRPCSQVDPMVLWQIDETVTPDVPGQANPSHMPFDEWREFVLERPLYQPEGSFVAYADGEPAAISMLAADLETGRAVTIFTGTLREFRGRGLGLAAKLASLRWAAANGVTYVSTINDETNAPMLAINDRLGYKPAGRRVEYVLER